jgi:hypothetical protein
VDFVVGCTRGRLGEGGPLVLSPDGPPNGQCRLDLRAARFVEPLGLVEVVVRAEHHRRRGHSVQLLAPTDRSVANYLARMRLGWALTDLGVTHDLPYVREHQPARQLLELTYFESTAGSDELAAAVYHRVAPDSAARARALYTSLSEVGQNVPDHAGVTGGWAAAQTTRRHGEMWFAVGDSGVGMRASLSSRGACSDADALVMAVDRGLSRFATAGHGNGLVETCRLVTAQEGRVHMTSGTSARTVSTLCRATTARGTAVPGTLLQGSLPYRVG